MQTLAMSVDSITLDESDWLPTEIFQQILLCLSPNDPSTIPTILNCMQCSKRFYSMASFPLIWRRQYLHRWTLSDPGHEAARVTECKGDWSRMYAVRARRDIDVVSIVREMSIAHEGRLLQAQNVAKVYGKDCWNVLKSLADNGMDSQRFAEAYWAGQLREAMVRKDSYECLLKLHDDGNSCTFEEGLSTLSSFFGIHYDEIGAILDNLADRCRQFLEQQGIPLPGSPRCELGRLSVEICRWMRMEGFVAAEGDAYYRVAGNFLHEVLHSHRSTLPLSLVCVFVSLGQRIGLKAYPVNFPGHVLAWVGLSTDGDEHIHVDVYGSSTQPIITPADINRIFTSYGVDPAEYSSLLGPANTLVMVKRALNNVIASVRRPPVNANPFWFRQRVYSGVALVQAILAHNNAAAWRLNVIAVGITTLTNMHYPLDAVVALEPLLAVRFPESDLSHLKKEISKANGKPAPEIVLRRDDLTNPNYFVGMVVRQESHDGSPQQQIGIIVGWRRNGAIIEYTCPQTCFHMRYDSYSFAEEQHFVPIRCDTKEGAHVLLKALLRESENAGRYFVDSTVSNSGCIWLVPGDELRASFPDDLEAGRAWMEREDQTSVPELDLRL
ncbi:hypothetical protein FRC02_006807 [Tulasnella sp. 418]|nr:hypothetical protein FRC02_006807 [Tulasnella sp. 418]